MKGRIQCEGVASEVLQGFTLIEVVISIVVLLIGISGSLLVMSTSSQRAAAAQEKANAMHVARSQLEELHDVSFSNSRLSIGLHSNTTLGCTYQVAQYAGSSDLKQVTIRSVWLDHVRGNIQTEEVVTVMSRALH